MQKKMIWGTLDPFIEGGNILGRKIANRSFLFGLLHADPFDEYHFYSVGEDDLTDLERYLCDTFSVLYQRGALKFFLRAELPQKLEEYDYHCFHLSDFVERQVTLAVMRNKYSKKIFPITGVTHSLSYSNFMQNFLHHAWAGSSKRDAIIGTSQSAKYVIAAAFKDIIASYGEAICQYLPSTPIIPLGVDTQPEYISPETFDAVRRKIGIDNEPKLIFLSLARISPHSKMDFLPVLSAFKRAERLGLEPGSYRIVVAGWVEKADKAFSEALASMAKALGLCLSVLPCPTAEEKAALYELADVFLSPSDNVQETFGLTAVEAGIAGLPSIVSDFDGYMDTVIDGVTGIRVPTIGFSQTSETNSLSMLWSDNQYHLKLAQQTVVDIPAFANAIIALAHDKALRETMGKAAFEHTHKQYTWEKVISQYCDLWNNLWEIPIRDDEEKRMREAVHPLQMNYARIFHKHFTETLEDKLKAQVQICKTSMGDAYYKGVIDTFPYAGLELMLDKEMLHHLLFMARKPVLASLVITNLQQKYRERETSTENNTMFFEQTIQERIDFIVLWALKQDLIEIVR